VDTKGPGGQDIIVLEPGDDVNEGVLEGQPIHHAVVLVQQEQLPSNFRSVFRRLEREHACYFRGRESPCVVCDLVQYVALQFPLGLRVIRRIFGTFEREGRGGCECHRMNERGDDKRLTVYSLLGPSNDLNAISRNYTIDAERTYFQYKQKVD